MGTIRKENGRHRAAVLDRDHGVCALCGVDTERLRLWLESIPLIDNRREWRMGAVRPDTQLAFRRVLGRHKHRALVLLGRLWGVVIPNAKASLWQMDHALPVAEGGGGCGVDGLRTLCSRCHRHETAALAGRLARRTSKGVGRI